MKKGRVVVAALLLSAGVGTSQAGDGDRAPCSQSAFADVTLYRQLYLPRHEKNFIASLEFDVNGVVESALAEVTRVKLAQPGCHSKAITKALERLSIEGATPTIRYKAHLANMVFHQPEVFREEDTMTYQNADDLFSAIAAKLQKSLLTSNAVL